MVPLQQPGQVQAPCIPPGPLARSSNIAPVLTAGLGQHWPPITAPLTQAEFKLLVWIQLVLVLRCPGLAAGWPSLVGCPCVLDGGPDVWEARQGMGGMQMLQDNALNSYRRECKELGKCSLIAALGPTSWRLPSFLGSVSFTNTISI